MDALVFWLTFWGLTLQLLGTTIAGFGIVGGSLVHYSPLDVLIPVLSRVIPPNIAAQNPLFRPLYIGETRGEGRDERYNRWDLILSLLILTLFYLVLSVCPFVILAFLLKGQNSVPWWLILWFAILVFINLGPLITQHRLMPQQNLFLRFLLNWMQTPLISGVIVVSLNLQIVMHVFAWLTRYDLSVETNRIKYYAIYSISSIFFGTILLFVALFYER